MQNIRLPPTRENVMKETLNRSQAVAKECGNKYLLSEAKIITGGLINKFLKGKSYNHCHRGNLLLATAMHGSHLERFIEYMNIPSTNLLQELENWAIVDKSSR